MLALLMAATVCLGACQYKADTDNPWQNLRLEECYVKAVKLENEFGPDGANGPSANPGARLETAHIYTLEFWQGYREFQNKAGQTAALKRLRKIVTNYGLCMIMDSDFGRSIVGRENFNQMLTASRSKETMLFKSLFGTPATQGGD